MTLAGLRPGEKLFEEKLMAEEGLKKTKNKLIHMRGNTLTDGMEKLVKLVTGQGYQVERDEEGYFMWPKKKVKGQEGN